MMEKIYNFLMFLFKSSLILLSFIFIFWLVDFRVKSYKVNKIILGDPMIKVLLLLGNPDYEWSKEDFFEKGRCNKVKVLLYKGFPFWEKDIRVYIDEKDRKVLYWKREGNLSKIRGRWDICLIDFG